MTILFLCYWGVEEGLTAATVIPHLRILNENELVDNIVFVTIERERRTGPVDLPPKVTHVSLTSGKKYLNKIIDFVRFPAVIEKLISDHKITFMFCKGTPAGALGYLVYRRSGIQYAVESVEPHAEYMLESGVWKKWGFRYNFQRWWEGKQIATARYLLPVASGMKEFLTAHGIQPERIHIMPCAVDHQKFSFKQNERDRLRSSLKIDADCVTGIYLGKFGGLYYDEEAFDIFKFAFSFFEKFKLLILTPNNVEHIYAKLLEKGLNPACCHVTKVKHSEVPAYLSAADLAFALIKPTGSKRFSSPIKIGEYWSVGLPVLITEGIGEDSEIIQTNKAGATFRLTNLQPAFERIRKILNDDPALSRHKIRGLAIRYRSFETNREIYRKIIYEIAAR